MSGLMAYRIKFYVISTALVALLFLIPYLRQSAEDTLVDWTGETDPKQQLVAIYSSLFQSQVETDDFAPMRYSDVNPYGANVFFEQEVEEWKLEKSMQMLRDAGVKWVRQEVPWSDIEINAKGDYEGPYGNTWVKYDRFINLANEYGLEIVARLDDPPNWSRVDNSVHNRPPDNFDDYGDFVYQFVSRYKGKIKYIQIWNEPNVYPEWGNRAVDAKAYTELLKVAYTRAKEANPDIVVLAASLAPTLGEEGGRSESDLTYLQEMYDSGAKDYFDIMTAQGYGLWTGPGDRRLDPERVNFSRPQLIREIMVKNGDENKSVWISELGWNALPDDFPTPPTHGKVTRDEQARYTVNAYKRATEEWPWVGVIFYWHFRMVHDENRNQVMFYFGMADPDFTTYPVYSDYAQMANSTPTVYRGYRLSDNWALDYKGHWQDKVVDDSPLGRYKVSASKGDSVSFTFDGTELDLVAGTGSNQGKLYVTIDGSDVAPNMLPRDSQRKAYIDLADPENAGKDSIPIARGLMPGKHQVRVTVAEEGKLVALKGIIVNSTNTYLNRLGFGGFLSISLGLFMVSVIRKTIKGRRAAKEGLR